METSLFARLFSFHRQPVCPLPLKALILLGFLLFSYVNALQRGEFVERKLYEYDGVIHELPDNGGAYVVFPWDIREEFGKGRIKVHAEFDGFPYDGSIVNMGLKDKNGNVCYIIGLLKVIRKQMKKGDGDSVHVVIRELSV